MTRIERPVGTLIFEKTAGNPFFVIQFIFTLIDEGLVAFDHTDARWCWDLGRIEAKGYTDNVVDLMVGRLNRLPARTQEALQRLACLGNSAGMKLLSMVRASSEEKVHADLWDARMRQLVVRSEGAYRFVHDRVHEAAYSLIPEERRAEAHLGIGRLLLQAHIAGRARRGDLRYRGSIRRGAKLITLRDEREKVAELNLVAGRRAKVSAAYASALKYLVAGAVFLAEDCWERRHDLIFQLELHRAECEFLIGDLDAADAR